MSSQLDSVVFHLMRKIFQGHTAQWQQALPELTKPQFAVLKVVSGQPGIEQVQLMDAAVSTKATLADLLARLEKRGLIVRRQRKHDKRRRFVYLTNEGESLLQSVSHVAQDVDQQFLSRLSAADQQTLLRLLHQMIAVNSEQKPPEETV